MFDYMTYRLHDVIAFGINSVKSVQQHTDLCIAGTQACSKGVSKGPLRPAAGPRGVRAKPSADHVSAKGSELKSFAYEDKH
eukprot:5814429-Amphidinium_carterae.1